MPNFSEGGVSKRFLAGEKLMRDEDDIKAELEKAKTTWAHEEGEIYKKFTKSYIENLNEELKNVQDYKKEREIYK